MWANYEFKTDNRYNELRGIIKRYNKAISSLDLPSEWAINNRMKFSELITHLKSNLDQILLEHKVSRKGFPKKVLKLYDSIDAGKTKGYVKFYPDVYSKVLSEMSGPAARLYLAFKLFVRHQGEDEDTTFVSRQKLATTLDVTVNWVGKYVAELKKLGLLENLAAKGSRKNNWLVK